MLGDPWRSEQEKVGYMEAFGWKDKKLILHLARKLTKKVEAQLKDPKYPLVEFEGRTVYVHRLAVYQYTGDWQRGLTVHHINHDRHDNRPENLYLCTELEHKQIHEGLIDNPSTGNLDKYKKVN